MVKGSQAMEQFDKAATLIVHHQPRQRSFAGAGRFLTEITAHIWRYAQFETHIIQKRDISMTISSKTTMEHTNIVIGY